MQAFDDRIVRFGFEADGKTTFFEGLDIQARGIKRFSALGAQCEITISNLTAEQRNYILKTASPLTQPGRALSPVHTIIDVGRKSYGTFRLFDGTTWSGSASQPPDIEIVLQSTTNNFEQGVTRPYYQSGVRSLKIIAQSVADSYTPPLQLDFQARDKAIDNWSSTSDPGTQLERLNQMGGIIAKADSKTLTVIDSDKAIRGVTRKINMNTGMVGVPQVMQYGVVVKMMIENDIELGGSVEIESKINPAANGAFRIDQINFDVANRHDPFYYTLICSNLRYAVGSVE